MKSITGAAVLLGLTPVLLTALALPAAGQETPPATLSLEEAIAIARRSNPDFLARANDAGPADWAVREAWGALLPGASASTTFSWQEPGTPRFGIFTGDDFGFGTSTGYYSSNYTLGLSYRLSGSALLAPGREKANRAATDAGIAEAMSLLDADVTRQYVGLARARAGVIIAEEELARAEEDLRLANARAQVGAVAQIESRQAEVLRGRAEVALLQARNQAEADRLALMRVLGIELDRDLALTTDFTVHALPWQADELLTIAIEANPQLRAARASERAAEVGVRMARSSYLPSLSLSAGVSGYTREATNDDFLVDQARSQIASSRNNCIYQNQLSARLVEPLPGFPMDCSSIMLTPAQEAEIRASNESFPFGFTREPFGVSATFSLPIFQGFSRQRQLEEAKVAEDDAGHLRRAEELRIRQAVETAYNTVVTAIQSVELEVRNRELADDQLRLAREQYRLGAGSFLELREAEAVKARADRAWLGALYQYHEGLATLEQAVGRPLRPTLEGR